MRTCVDCECLKDVGDEWLCQYFGETTVNPERYNAKDCEYYKGEKNETRTKP